MVSRSVHFLRFLFLITTLVAGAAGLTAAGGPLTGTVVDPDGRPVPSATVLISAGGEPLRTTTTDARGRFDIDVPGASRLEIRVAMPGFRSETRQIDSGRDSDVGAIRLAVSAVSESVVVSAAQVEIPLSQATSAVTVIQGSELRDRQIHSVADALRTVPGLTVVAAGSTGAVTGVFPRGGESNFTLVLVDDVPVNAFGGDFDFAHLSTVNVERIEIVRGPQSALFGSNAIGAVVRVITRQGGAPQASAVVEGGGYGALRTAAASSGSRGAFEWGVSGERLQGDGYNGHTTAAGLRVENDDYERSSGSVSLGWRRGGSMLRGRVQHGVDERGTPGPFGTNPIGAYTAIDTISRGRNNRSIASLSAAMPLGRGVRGGVQAAYSRLESNFSSRYGDSESHSRRLGGRAQFDFRLAGIDLSAGADVQRERTGSTFITGERFQPIPIRRWSAGYFAEGRWQHAQRLFVTAGARVDDIRRERIEASPDQFSPRPVLEEDSLVKVNPRLGVSWLATTDPARFTRLRLTAATGIRPPDGFDLAFTDNPALRTEKSRSIEAGIEQAFAGGHLIADIVGFTNDYDDLIVAVGSFRESSRYTTDNISNARARGVEIGLTGRARIAAARPIDLTARAAYTRLDTEILAVDGSATAPPPFEVGDDLLRRPRHQFSLEATATTRSLTAFVAGRARGRALDVEPSFGTFGGLHSSDGFAAWSAGGAYRLRAAELFGRVENLFDRDYEEALGFPALGRRLVVGLRVAAGQ